MDKRTLHFGFKISEGDHRIGQYDDGTRGTYSEADRQAENCQEEKISGRKIRKKTAKKETEKKIANRINHVMSALCPLAVHFWA
jgi:hypothetical protein